MAGYSAKPLWPKLGLGPDAEVLLIDAPAGWSIPGAPEQLSLTREASGARASAPAQDVIAFFQALAGLREGLPPIAERIFPRRGAVDRVAAPGGRSRQRHPRAGHPRAGACAGPGRREGGRARR